MLWQVIKIIIYDTLEEVLSDMMSISDIQASVLVSDNGLMVAGKSNIDSVGSENFASLIAMLMRSGTHTTRELKKKELEYLLVNTKNDGQIILIKAASNAILAVLTDTNTNSVSIIAEMKEAAEKIKNILSKI